MASTDHSRFQFAAERYILGELPEAEKLAFEEHYFECGACAQDVEDLTNLRLAAPVVLPRLDRDSPKSQSASWFGRPWMPQLTWGALAALMLITGYQNAVEIPRLKAMPDDSLQVMAAPNPPLVAERSERRIVIPGLPRMWPLLIANEWLVTYEKYEARIKRHGENKILMQSKAEAAPDALFVAIPAKKLGAGSFDLILSGIKAGGTAEDLTQYSFTIQGE